jgi:acylglycerol lipase
MISRRALACALALAWLAGCSPQVQATRPAVQPESTPKLHNTELVAADGEQLPMRSWLPRGRYAASPKAVIIALHGFNDYSNAFTGTGEYFSKRGMAVFAYDQRGFGRTQDIGIWAGRENLLRDIASAVKQARKRFPRAPLFLLGESMGGAVVLVASTQPDFPKVDGLVLVSPAVWGDEAMSIGFRATLLLGAYTFPGSTFTGSDLKIIASNNYPMLRALSRDPLIIKQTRLDAVYGLVGLMGEAYRAVPDVTQRTLVLGGALDQVIPPEAIHIAARRFTAPMWEVWYPDGYHMLLRDLQGERVMRDIEQWMLRPSAQLPSGFLSYQSPGKSN